MDDLSSFKTRIETVAFVAIAGAPNIIIIICSFCHNRACNIARVSQSKVYKVEIILLFVTKVLHFCISTRSGLGSCVNPIVPVLYYTTDYCKEHSIGLWYTCIGQELWVYYSNAQHTEEHDVLEGSHFIQISK